MARDFIPHDNQHEALDWIHKHKRCALLAPMGFGKSGTTLKALDDLSLVEDVFPALILAPKRVAISTWGPEAKKWSNLSHLRVVAVVGTLRERIAALKVPADIYTTNYENIDWLVTYLGDKWPFKTVVADELPKLKSYRTRQGGKNSGALGKVAHTYVDRFIGLTGTPAPNGIKDLWGPAWFIDKGERLGKSFSAFEARWFRKGFDGFSLEPFPHSQGEIEGLLSDVCLTVKGLPVDEPIVSPVYVDLDPKSRALYREMEKNFFIELEEIGVEAVNAAVKTGKMLQIASGAAYTDDKGNWTPIHNLKLEALESIVEEANGAPVLVSYQFKSDAERLLKHFRKARMLDTDPKTIDRWNEGGIAILLAHPACLHPSTEVLTEFRDWVKLIDVRRDERVFDGVEFVSHRGCSFSGVKPVIETFGVVMTPEHKILVGCDWMEAQHVRDREDIRRKARYTYEGDDPRLTALLPVWGGADRDSAKRGTRQYRAPGILPGLSGRHVSPDDEQPVLVNLARDERSRHRSERFGLRTLRWGWTRLGPCVVELQKLLCGYVRGVRGSLDDRANRQLQGLFQSELSLGYQHGAAGQQEQQSDHYISRSRDAFGGVLSGGRGGARRHSATTERGHDRGRGRSRLCQIHIQEEPEIESTAVYDL